MASWWHKLALKNTLQNLISYYYLTCRIYAKMCLRKKNESTNYTLPRLCFLSFFFLFSGLGSTLATDSTILFTICCIWRWCWDTSALLPSRTTILQGHASQCALNVHSTTFPSGFMTRWALHFVTHWKNLRNDNGIELVKIIVHFEIVWFIIFRGEEKSCTCLD